MKKFIKKRRPSKDRAVTFAPDSGQPSASNVNSGAIFDYSTSSGIESDYQLDAEDHQPGATGSGPNHQTINPRQLQVENNKLKRSVQHLLAENGRMREQLENRNIVQVYGDSAEIKSLAAQIIADNEKLENQLTLEKELSDALKESIDKEVETMSRKLDQVNSWRAASDQQFWQLLLEHETLRRSFLARETDSAHYVHIRDHKSTIVGLKELLGKLRANYHGKLARVEKALDASKKEHRSLALDLASIKTELKQKNVVCRDHTRAIDALTLDNDRLLREVAALKAEISTLEKATEQLLESTYAGPAVDPSLAEPSEPLKNRDS